jgi:hypothetical protein
MHRVRFFSRYDFGAISRLNNWGDQSQFVRRDNEVWTAKEDHGGNRACD